MRLLPLLVAALTFTACQASPWQGVWTGTATLNDGRMPTTATGTLTITTGAGTPASLLFAFSGTLPGNSRTFSCPPAVSTAASTATTATLAANSTCRMTASPDDGCTHEVTFTSGELTLAADKLTGSGQGRLSSACPGMGSSVSDFGWTVSASERK